jgi:hypothetical protein
MNAEEFRAKIEREVDDMIAKIRAPDRAFLLSQGFSASEIAELMRLQDARFRKCRDEMVAEIYSRALRYAAAPDAPSHAVH